MKQEIRERIEKIHKGEVPEGYQKTKVGIIPEEWDAIEIGKMFEFKNGLNKEKEFFGHGKKIVNFTDVYNNRGIKVRDLKGLVNVNTSELERYKVDKGDVFFTRTSETIHDIGMSSVVLESEEEAVFSGFILRARPKNNMLSLNFKKYCFSTNKARKEIVIKSSYTTRALTSGTLLNKVLIAVPPESEEQEKIAEIISTWEKAIELKEKLIEEKKKFKKGLIQKLLTGKIRFPGFTGEWTEIPLNNIVERITSKNEENNKTVITISSKEGFVNQDEYFNKLVASKDLSEYFLLKKGDFVYNKSYSNGYPVGAIKRLDSFENAVVTTLYICFRIKEQKVSSNFLKQYFDSGLLNIQIKRIANEGGRAHGLLNVTPNDFFNVKVNLPEYEEQEKISEILITNEQNIQLSEKDIFELKEQKKGLMQLLLTGIVRVEVD